MLLSTILRDVRIALNMNHSCQALIDEHDLDTLTLDERITSLVEPMACEVLMAAPLLDLGEGSPISDTVHWDHRRGHGAGTIILPPDFLRLITFRMSGWGRAATIIQTDDPRALWQHCPFPGVHGNPHRPVAFVEPHQSVEFKLHCALRYLDAVDKCLLHVVKSFRSRCRSQKSSRTVPSMPSTSTTFVCATGSRSSSANAGGANLHESSFLTTY